MLNVVQSITLRAKKGGIHMRSRKKVIDLAKSWIGKKESDGSYKLILTIWNSYKGKKPRAVTMKEGMAWCACTWSALAIKLGYTDIMPIEVSCGELINQAKKMGCWVEKDSYIPKPADAILYDWNDNGVGDNTGWPDHIGVVESVDSENKKMVIIEGNYKDGVGRRTVEINGKYIRGFITPKYTEDMEVISEKKKEVTATEKAKGKKDSLSGTYITTDDLSCRDGAGVDKKRLSIIPKGTKVKNYGYYTMVGNKKWLLIQYTSGNTVYTGFASGTYLKK